MQSGAEYDNVLNHSVILCKTQVQGIRTLKEVPGSSGMLQNTTVNWRRCTCVGCVSGQNDADDLEQPQHARTALNHLSHRLSRSMST